MPDFSALKELVNKFDAIITAASQSWLGIAALFLLGVFTVGLIFFYQASPKLRVSMFLLMLVSGLGVVIIGSHGSQAPAAKNPAVQNAPGHNVTYVGRVFNRATRLPVDGAEASIEIGQSVRSDITDSQGIYRLRFSNVPANSDGRITVSANHYKVYDSYLSPEDEVSVKQIPLNPEAKSSPPPARARTLNYVGRVLDREFRSPIVGAKVTLGTHPAIYTDSEGVFSFVLSAPPKESLRVMADGYETYDERLPQDSTGSIDVRLKKASPAAPR